jgi:replicative superfamily II helicase
LFKQGLFVTYTVFNLLNTLQTSLFEIAILGMLKEYVISPGGEHFQLPKDGQTKAIYVAPTKSLVQEK